MRYSAGLSALPDDYAGNVVSHLGNTPLLDATAGRLVAPPRGVGCGGADHDAG